MISSKIKDRMIHSPSFYNKIPDEMSREILRFVNPTKPPEKSGKNYIVKHGKLEIKWCELCGEYLYGENIDWAIITLPLSKIMLLYTCCHCNRESVIEVR